MASPTKRPKLTDNSDSNSAVREKRARFLASLSRGVSPPQGKASVVDIESARSTRRPQYGDAIDSSVANSPASIPVDVPSEPRKSPSKSISSPVQLTRIRDLPESGNKNTVTLHDILGDPLIKEAWIFNFCFDVDWLMQHFDTDVQHMVKVKIVHGSWRREDMNKIMIDDACNRMSNVDAVQAYLPDAFGTHHSKMFILFRHDDTAEVVIHTANMLAKDWTNMTQAVWKSPRLPKVPSSGQSAKIGSGARFKHDLLRYLRSYGSKLKTLVSDLEQYSFDQIRAALIASVPSKRTIRNNEAWGHEALRRVVKEIPATSQDPHFIFQVSSIATLPATWMKDTLYHAIGSTANNVSIVFPTAEDVRISLDGYSAGGSIHTKAQKDVHLKQISSLRPQLCRWAAEGLFNAGRVLAAPHIKTYVRFAKMPTREDPAPEIEWALVTSANLSTQAWGSASKLPKGSKDLAESIIHIQSYEIGVMVWPQLFAEDSDDQKSARSVSMVPVFGSDAPAHGSDDQTVVGFRMPYDLPLTSYKDRELPWSPQSAYETPDSHGLTWPPV